MKAFKEFSSQFVIFGLIAAVVVGLVLFVSSSDDDEASEDNVDQVQMVDEGESQTQPADGVEPALETEETTLDAVNGFDATGIATRSFSNGQFLHEVIAQLPELPEGTFYEGWIVGDSVISTGMLEREAGEDWSLVYTNPEDLTDSHSQVVITQETLADGLDGNPEIHVLEGSF